MSDELKKVDLTETIQRLKGFVVEFSPNLDEKVVEDALKTIADRVEENFDVYICLFDNYALSKDLNERLKARLFSDPMGEILAGTESALTFNFGAYEANLFKSLGSDTLNTIRSNVLEGIDVFDNGLPRIQTSSIEDLKKSEFFDLAKEYKMDSEDDSLKVDLKSFVYQMLATQSQLNKLVDIKEEFVSVLDGLKDRSEKAGKVIVDYSMLDNFKNPYLKKYAEFLKYVEPELVKDTQEAVDKELASIGVDFTTVDATKDEADKVNKWYSKRDLINQFMMENKDTYLVLKSGNGSKFKL